jgi:hypothetical protein
MKEAARLNKRKRSKKGKKVKKENGKEQEI